MIHAKRLLLSFGTAWVLSIAGLLVVGIFTQPVANAYSADPTGDALRAFLVIATASLMCVGAAFGLIGIPYYFLFLGTCGRWSLILHSLVAGASGFLFMILATQWLPVANDSWRLTSPVAFAAGFCGAIMTRRDLFFTKTRQAKQGLDGNT